MANKAQELQKKVVTSLIEKIKAGVHPWQSPYIGNYRNPMRNNGIKFRGINSVLLLFEAMANEYRSPYWLTYNQSRKFGGQVRRGEKATPVFFYKHVEKHDPTHDGADSEGNVNYKFLRATFSFNADQIDGLPDHFYYDGLNTDDETRGICKLSDAKLALVPATIKYLDEGASYYNFIDDYIGLRKREDIKSDYQYTSTWCHELCHWAGGKGRLDRDMKKGMSRREYALEEIVVETSMTILCAEFGISPDHMDNHASYLKNYLEMMEEDPSFLFKIAAEAQRTVDYVKQFWEAEAETADNQKIAA